MDMRPHTRAEIERWAHRRQPHEREPVPEIGERVEFRQVLFGGTEPAVMVAVQDMGDPHNHWHRHGDLELERGPGMPDVHVWTHPDPVVREHPEWWTIPRVRAQLVLLPDPWPLVQVQVIRTEGGEEHLCAPTWCREARVRGSRGWMRPGSRAHAGRYEAGE
jgi:hypothetical protein